MRLERRPELDAKLRRLLEDLRGALSKALSESTDVSRSMSRIRDEGWSLYLVVDRKSDDDTPEAFELSAAQPSRGKPVFRIDGRDLTFLKSIGIDPTRHLRRRRS